MTLATDVPPAPGRRIHIVLSLRTASGKPIGPVDLLVTHTKLLHLMVVDPSLRDYQHIHPVPGRAPGDWEADLTPQRAGRYLVFADFTPAATARGLYASAEFSVPGTPDLPPPTDNWINEEDGLRCTLTPDAPIRARAVVNLTLTVESVWPWHGHLARASGRDTGILPVSSDERLDSDLPPVAEDRQPVPLEPVMGAYAHLVAFDAARSGFAHLHPQQVDSGWRPDLYRPQLNFRVQIPQPGRFVIWSQIKTGGRERFAPFWIEVAP